MGLGMGVSSVVIGSWISAVFRGDNILATRSEIGAFEELVRELARREDS
jgi:hypothetical protein